MCFNTQTYCEILKWIRTFWFKLIDLDEYVKLQHKMFLHFPSTACWNAPARLRSDTEKFRSVRGPFWVTDLGPSGEKIRYISGYDHGWESDADAHIFLKLRRKKTPDLFSLVVTCMCKRGCRIGCFSLQGWWLANSNSFLHLFFMAHNLPNTSFMTKRSVAIIRVGLSW